jgi:hypothetical protein
MQRKARQMATKSARWILRGGGAAAVIAVAAVVWLPTAAAKEALSLEQARVSFRIAEAPAAALSVGDAQKILEKAPKNRAAVTIVGRIAAREGEDPFLEGSASFVMMDLPDDDHSSKKGHDADNCPFCKRRKAKAALAAVQFVDADGAVVAIDARKLFGLRGGEKVVVRGQGYFNPKLPFPIVQLNAEGIHVLEAAPQ